MRATFLPFSPPDITEAEIAEVVDTLRSDWITTGPKVQAFQSAFAALVDAPDALALHSCTAALHVALAALGVGPGDAVFTTTLTFAATVNVIEHQGATPVLVDVEGDTLNLDPGCLAEAIATLPRGLRPRAVIPVHFGGHPCDMESIERIAYDHGLAIIEDAAHALPAAIGARPIGAVPDSPVPRATAFSFYATKNLTTAEGGMLTASAELLEEARLWSLHGMSRDAWKRYGQGGSWFYEVVRPGFKYNMTDLQAALGLVQIKRLGAMHARRAAIAERYSTALSHSDALVLPAHRPGTSHAWHLFVIRLNPAALLISRDAFLEELGKRNIGTSVHFIPIHLHPYYRDKYSFDAPGFPVAQRAFEAMLSLPLNTRMTDQDVEDVVAAVDDVVATYRR